MAVKAPFLRGRPVFFAIYEIGEIGIGMTLEEAIQKAIEYETNIRDLYREAQSRATDPKGEKIFKALGDDEQYHLDYLLDALKSWRETGILSISELVSNIPSVDDIRTSIEKIESHMSEDDLKDEKQMLGKALRAEIETSDFYKSMMDAFPQEGRELFEEFFKIENRHIDAVQAELDYLSKTGYWFDFKEFDMEGY